MKYSFDEGMDVSATLPVESWLTGKALHFRARGGLAGHGCFYGDNYTAWTAAATTTTTQKFSRPSWHRGRCFETRWHLPDTLVVAEESACTMTTEPTADKQRQNVLNQKPLTTVLRE